jgi:hypothetical protein
MRVTKRKSGMRRVGRRPGRRKDDGHGANDHLVERLRKARGTLSGDGGAEVNDGKWFESGV